MPLLTTYFSLQITLVADVDTVVKRHFSPPSSQGITLRHTPPQARGPAVSPVSGWHLKSKENAYGEYQ